ncbi:MAG: hypothetical protein GSR84_07715 [Desulfurococcales archaeon]|nr:hypothetical protein [Desulfurococcales archaeon]
MSLESVTREILSRRDPHGYYVIPAKEEARSLARGPGIIVIDVGDGILIKTRSRSQAIKLLRLLHRRGLLAEEEEM